MRDNTASHQHTVTQPKTFFMFFWPYSSTLSQFEQPLACTASSKFKSSSLVKLGPCSRAGGSRCSPSLGGAGRFGCFAGVAATAERGCARLRRMRIMQKLTPSTHLRTVWLARGAELVDTILGKVAAAAAMARRFSCQQ